MIYGTPEFNDTLVRIIKEKYKHPYYETACRLAREMSVHVYGEKPVELLDRVRPGEDDAIKDYRLANYEPTTKAPCGKAIKIVSKIFNPNLSSIIFPKDNKNAESLKEYTMEYFPVYNSLTVYNKDVTLKKMIADANAVMAIKPQRKPRNDAERVKPIVVIYGCESVWNWDYDHYLIFIGKEEVNNEVIHTFEYYDYLQVMRFTAKITSENQLITEVLLDTLYTHNFVSEDGEQEIPAWKLRGNSIPLPDGEIVYESYFADAQAHWNLSIIHESDVLGSFIKHMNPQRYVIGEECHHEKEIEGFRYKCVHGRLRSIGNLSPRTYTCDVCQGSGKVGSSPYEDHILLKQKIDEMTNISVDSSIGYVKVPIDATKLLAERADAMVQKGSAAINMDIEDKVGENQSGIAKVYDRSAQNNTIYDIGVTMYDVHFQNQFYFINKYLFATESKSGGGKNLDKNLPQINKPTHFDVESIPELLAGMKAAKDAGVDRNAQQSKEIAYISRDMETNPDLKRYYIAIIDLDPLYGMSQQDIDANLAKGLVYKTDAVIHANLKAFVDRAISEDNRFLDLTKQEKLAKLKVYADELIASEKPKLDVNLMPDEAGGFGQGD